MTAWLALSTGCKSKRPLVIQQKDSVRIETRYRTEWKTDTAYIEIPTQTAQRETKDSVSKLENDYAVSVAHVYTDGTLFHSLATKPQSKPVSVNTPINYKDSIVYIDREREKAVEVEREYTLWDKTRFKMFFPLIGMVVLAVCIIGLVKKKA